MREEIIDFLSFKLVDTDKIDFTVWNLLLLIFSLVFTTYILRLIRNLITRRLPQEDKNKFVSVFQFIKYIAYIIAIMFTLHTSGVNINVFLTASAAVFVGIGFALQTFFQDIIFRNFNDFRPIASRGRYH